MYQNNQMRNYQTNQIVNLNRQIPYQNNQDDRFLGLFAVPFLLGGVTGALIAPRRPYPVPYPVYPQPYPVPYQSYNYYYR